MEAEKNKLKVICFALALGVTGAIGMFVLGLLAWLLEWGVEAVKVFGSVYIGYEPTFGGTILGTLWGFVDWFIGGFLIAWFYNLFLCCHCPVKSNGKSKKRR